MGKDDIRTYFRWWKVPLSPVVVWLAVVYPLLNWSIHWFLPFGLIFALFGATLITTFVLLLLSYTLLRRVRLRIAWPLALLLLLALTTLGWYAPIYSWNYGYSINNRFLEMLDIPVVQESQLIETRGYASDVGGPRSVETIYRVLTTTSETEQKLLANLRPEDGWLVSKNNQGLYAVCPEIPLKEKEAQLLGYNNKVWIDKEERLVTKLYYFSSPRCRS